MNSEINYEKELYIKLDDKILFYIDDCISVMSVHNNSKSKIKPYKLLEVPSDLIKNVGIAIAELIINKSNKATLKVSTMDLFMLREIALSNAYIDKYPVGLELKKCIHKALYTADFEQQQRIYKIFQDLNRKKPEELKNQGENQL